jgi:hypothetical protein
VSYSEWTVGELETWADRLREMLDNCKTRTILHAVRMAEWEHDLKTIETEITKREEETAEWINKKS